MAQSVRLDRSTNFAAGVLGAAVVVGLGVAAVAYNRQRVDARPHGRGDKLASLAAYLREHLTGSDAAIQVVERLRLVHAGTPGGPAVRVALRRVPRRARRRPRPARADRCARRCRSSGSPARRAARCGHCGRRRARRSLAVPHPRGAVDRRPGQALHVAGAAIAARRPADSRARAAWPASKRWRCASGRRSRSAAAAWCSRRSRRCTCRSSTCRSSDAAGAVQIRRGTVADAAASRPSPPARSPRRSPPTNTPRTCRRTSPAPTASRSRPPS